MNTTLFNSVNVTINSDVSTNSLLFTSDIIQCSVLIIYIIFGLIGNIFNIFLFTCPALFQISCSLYLLATSIANLLVTIFVIPFRLSADIFNQDITSYSTLSCSLVSYIYYVCLALSPFFTVLASTDRWAASCVQVNRRRFASAHTAKRMILFTIILCCLLYSYILVVFSRDPQPPPPFCSADDTYAVFALSFYLIIYSLVPPFLMGLFSVSIISNVLRKQVRIMPAIQVINRAAINDVMRRDRHRLSQMQVMLVSQAIIECILTLPFSIINLISITVTNDEYFLDIYSFFRLFMFINYVSSFYVYTLSSKLYRNEFKKLVKRLFHRR